MAELELIVVASKWQIERISGVLVRCDECKYCYKYSTPDTLILLCRKNRGALKEVWAMDYCSWGERKEKVEYENADGIPSEHFRIGYEKGRRDGYAEAITEIEKGKKNEMAK